MKVSPPRCTTWVNAVAGWPPRVERWTSRPGSSGASEHPCERHSRKSTGSVKRARLVDEPRRVAAHQLGVAARRPRASASCAVVAAAPRARTGSSAPAKPPNERPSTRRRSRPARRPRAPRTAPPRPTRSLAWPRSSPMRRRYAAPRYSGAASVTSPSVSGKYPPTGGYLCACHLGFVIAFAIRSFLISSASSAGMPGPARTPASIKLHVVPDHRSRSAPRTSCALFTQGAPRPVSDRPTRRSMSTGRASGPADDDVRRGIQVHTARSPRQ